jgi:hypothetical protein
MFGKALETAVFSNFFAKLNQIVVAPPTVTVANNVKNDDEENEDLNKQQQIVQVKNEKNMVNQQKPNIKTTKISFLFIFLDVNNKI